MDERENGFIVGAADREVLDQAFPSHGFVRVHGGNSTRSIRERSGIEEQDDGIAKEGL